MVRKSLLGQGGGGGRGKAVEARNNKLCQMEKFEGLLGLVVEGFRGSLFGAI